VPDLVVFGVCGSSDIDQRITDYTGTERRNRSDDTNSAAPSNIVSDLVIAVAMGTLVLIPSLILLLLVFKTHRESISVDADTTPV
jgi:hypothetical protein